MNNIYKSRGKLCLAIAKPFFVIGTSIQRFAIWIGYRKPTMEEVLIFAAQKFTEDFVQVEPYFTEPDRSLN